jgi:uncharacterized protein (DUF58 family)
VRERALDTPTRPARAWAIYHPSPRGLAFAAIGLAPAALPALGLPELWTAWAWFWVLTLFAFVADVALAPRLATVEVDMPDRLQVGQPATIRVRAAAVGRRAAARLQLDLSDNLEPVAALAGEIGAAAVEWRVSLLPIRRGLAEVERAWVRITGPLGLMVRSARTPIGRSAPVLPRRATAGDALRFWSARELAAGLQIERFIGDGSEFESLRDFVTGLDRRSIDWKASARHTRLLSRQLRAERSHQIVVAVDTGRLMAEPLDGAPRLDHAVHAALLLGWFGVRAGDRIGLYAFSDRPLVFHPPRGGMSAFRALSERTADLDYSSAETNFTLGLSELGARLSRRSLIVVLTDFADSISAEMMVENVERLTRRHLVVFVALRDPLLAKLAEAEPQSSLDVERAIVADSLEREREVVLRRLARRGVHCVDAPPKLLGADLVNRWLDIKRRELL